MNEYVSKVRTHVGIKDTTSKVRTQVEIKFARKVRTKLAILSEFQIRLPSHPSSTCMDKKLIHDECRRMRQLR